jgi:ABC-type sugar transport system permease subunit
MSTRTLLLRIAGLTVIDASAIYLAVVLGTKLSVPLGIGIILVTLLINLVFLNQKLYPWRWLSPGLALLFLMVVYPVASTVFIAFTNYSDGHLLSKQQVIAQFEDEYYTPTDATTYKWTAFRSPAGQFVLWLVAPDGKTYLAAENDSALHEVTPQDTTSPFGALGARDKDGIPESVGDFARLTRIDVVRYLKQLQAVAIKAPPNLIRITSLDAAPAQRRLYSYDEATNTLKNTQTGDVYHEERGSFVTGEGENRKALTPGFATVIGLDNVLRLANDETVREPFWRVFVWTFVFATASVATTFTLGLVFALTLNARDLFLRPVFRSILIIPYALPGFIMALVWVGLLNPIYGPINVILKNLLGVSPPWFSDPTLAKIAILIVNLWLGYPYMMLVTLGALQSIPSDIYEAARIDGADSRAQFRFITLPLLLVSIAPLLIGAFAFNFNNFTVVDLVTQGGPPMVGQSVAGSTDILISYTYRLAFAGGQGADYGFASTIAIFIFIIVASLTIFNFRFTRQLEQVSENV